jgi:hypothetical protein
MLILNEKPLSYDRAFTHDGIQYPANWLRLASLEEKQAINIVEVPDAPVASWNQQFFWGVDNPKDHAPLVELWVRKAKDTAGSMLSSTDWYVTRYAETSTAIPQEVLERRAEIREYSNIKEAAIKATTTTEELAAYVTSPDYSLWSPPVVDDTVIFDEDTIIASEGDDEVIFSGGFASAGIVDSLSFD